MFNQPFCVSESLVTICIGDMFLRFFDPQIFPISMKVMVVPFDEMSCMCFGAAISRTDSSILLADWLGKRLVLLDSDLKMVREFGLPSLSPRSVARTQQRFWFTVEYGDFETRLGWLDDSLDGEIRYLDVQSGWSLQQLNLIGHPIILSHHERIVVFNALAGILFWIDDAGNVINSKAIPSDAILGPCTSGDIAFFSASDASKQVYRITSDDEVVAISGVHVKSCQNDVIGLCIASERIFALTKSGMLYMHGGDSDKWVCVFNISD